MLNDLLVSAAAIHGDEDHGHEHGHEHTDSILLDAWNIFTDPGHFVAEIGFTLILDFVVLFLGYQLLVKRVLIPRLKKQIHRDLDAELGVDHAQGDVHGTEEPKQ